MIDPSAEHVASGGPPGDGSADPFEGPDWATPAFGSGAAPAPAPAPAAGPEATGRRRVRVSRRRRRRRRRIGIAMLVLGGALLVGAAWIAVTGLMARGQLEAARTEVRTLRAQIKAGDLAAARRTAEQVRTHAGRAHSLTTGPAWGLAAALPAAGEPLRTVRGLTADIDLLGSAALPELVSASNALDPDHLRGPDGRIDVARIASVTPGLDEATRVMDAAAADIAALPSHTGIGALDEARRDVLAQVTALGRTVRSADLAARIVPPMLGADGVKRYFVAFQNNAEARGTGGLPGAFAILEADHGKITFTRFASDNLIFTTPVDVDLGPDYRRLYDGAATTSLYVNANLSPHFPNAAKIWSAMWERRSGQRVDGVIALDPAALGYLLAVTGPATLPDGTSVNSGDVVALTQSTVYARYPGPSGRDQAARKAFLLEIASAASHKVLDARGDVTGLVKAAGRAAGERRLLVYSASPSVEADLARTAVSGVVPVTSAPYVGLSIVNDGGNKLDYYLDRALTWQRSGCGSVRDVTVTVRLTNNAPAGGLSEYVTYRSDRHSYPVKPGDNRLEVSYLATSGALMRAVTVDGAPATATIGLQSGHPVYTVDVELPRASTRTVVLHLQEPAGSGAPVVLRQPLVRPLSVSLDDARCG